MFVPTCDTVNDGSSKLAPSYNRAAISPDALSLSTLMHNLSVQTSHPKRLKNEPTTYCRESASAKSSKRTLVLGSTDVEGISMDNDAEIKIGHVTEYKSETR